MLGAAPALAADAKKPAKAKKPKPVFLGEGLSYIVKKENDSLLTSVAPAVQVREIYLPFFFFTLVIGPRRSLSLKLSDTKSRCLRITGLAIKVCCLLYFTGASALNLSTNSSCVSTARRNKRFAPRGSKRFAPRGFLLGRFR